MHNKSPFNSSLPAAQTSFSRLQAWTPSRVQALGGAAQRLPRAPQPRPGPRQESRERTPQRGRRRCLRSSDHVKVTTKPAAGQGSRLVSPGPSLCREPLSPCGAATPEPRGPPRRSPTLRDGGRPGLHPRSWAPPAPPPLGQDPEASPGTVPSSFFALSTQLFPTPGRTGKRRRRRAGRRRINRVAGPAH